MLSDKLKECNVSKYDRDIAIILYAMQVYLNYSQLYYVNQRWINQAKSMVILNDVITIP
jgi:hypothetical protein